MIRIIVELQEVTYRLNLQENEYNELKKAINLSEIESDDLINKLNNPLIIHKTKGKLKAIQKATNKRSEIAKNKILNAINLLRLENMPISYANIQKRSGVGFNTIKKYVDESILTKRKIFRDKKVEE